MGKFDSLHFLHGSGHHVSLGDMPKTPKEKPNKLRLDVNEVAHRVMLEATGQKPKTPPPGERAVMQRQNIVPAAHGAGQMDME